MSANVQNAPEPLRVTAKEVIERMNRGEDVYFVDARNRGEDPRAEALARSRPISGGQAASE